MNENDFINNVISQLADYEDERKIRISRLQKEQTGLLFLWILCVLCFIGISVLLIYLRFFIFAVGFIFFGVSLCLYLGLFFIWVGIQNSNNANKSFKNFLKYKCKNEIFAAFNISTLKAKPFTLSEIQNSNLFYAADFIDYDDSVQGEYDNVIYKIAEAVISNEMNRVFKGVIISFSANKKIAAETVIASTFESIATTMFIEQKNFQCVKLEDVEFEKQFKVYSKEQIEARYIVTTAFMERLKSLETAFGSKDIKCSFFDDKIMFAIPTNKDLFELGSLFKPLNLSKTVERFYDELNSVHEIINHFKLDEKTGL